MDFSPIWPHAIDCTTIMACSQSEEKSEVPEAFVLNGYLFS